MSHQLARHASARRGGPKSFHAGRPSAPKHLASLRASRFIHIVALFVFGGIGAWWLSPPARAQEVVVREALPPSPISIPQALGAATFHNNTPVSVPPVGTVGTTNSTVTVSGFSASAVVYDVKVSFHITHTFDGNLDISLISPGGAVSVELTSDNGSLNDDYGVGCSGDNQRTTFDDSASTLITAGVAPFQGTFRPEEALSGFRGVAPNGTWTLRITDDAAGDLGTLNCWSLSIIPRYDNTTPLAIPDASTIESSLTLAGIQGAIERVQVSFHITHTFDSDLDMFLIAPDNTIIQLVTDNGGTGENFGTSCADGDRTVLDSAATTSLSAGTAPFVGTFDPDATLYALNGRSGSSANGTWTLRIIDDEGADIGTLNCWSLTVFPQRFDNNVSTAIGDPGVLTSAITVANFPGRVSDVNVSMNIDHAFDDDLDLSLMGPDGTTVELSTDNGGAGDDYGNSCNPTSNRTTFNDSAAISITAGVAPFAGLFRPEGLLSAFNGKAGNGTWDLRLEDDAAGVAGTKQCWSLQLTQQLPGDLIPTITDTPDQVVHGQNITYTITVTNQGPGPSTNAFMGITTPLNTTFVSAVAPAGWVLATPAVGGTGLVSAGKSTNMANGEVANFTVVVRVSLAVPPGSVINAGVGVDSLLDTVLFNDAATTNSTAIQMPTTTDADGDTLLDALETQFGLDPTTATPPDGPFGDPDFDDVTNADELAAGTHPRGFFTRRFAEGATSDFFDTSIALLNTSTTTPAITLLRHLRADGTTVSQFLNIPPLTRATVNPEIVMGAVATEFGSIIESDFRLIADRTMRWDANGYGSHTERALVDTNTTWYLAEGATHSGFNLFYLIQNGNPVAANIAVTYLLPAPAAPIVKNYVVGPNSRFNIWVNLEGPGLASTDVSAIVTSTEPVIVERAMYLNSGGLLFGAGHESAGVTSTDDRWFLAEGATGDYFDLFVLIANPNPTDSAITATYLLPDGSTVVKNYVVTANSRSTIWVDLEDPLLAATAVSTTIESTNAVPVIVERAMWWPGSSATWFEAHNSAGSTLTGTRWGLAEGEQGGPFSHETYILIANTSATPGSVDVTLYFEDSTSATRTFPLNPNSRFNVAVGIDFPEAIGRRFGAIVQSTGSPAAQIVVERAVYSNAFGIVWAAGSNALGTRY